MNLTDIAFEDFLKNVIPFIQPNEILDCPLRETNQYLDLVKMLPQKNHVLWKRVVLNYSAKMYDRDLAFYGLDQEELLLNVENLLPDTITILYYYYFGVDLREYNLIEEYDEYYYKSDALKIPTYHIECAVCRAVSQDYNILHNYIEGFIEGKSQRSN
jgi:hypothetical protein